MKRWGFNYRLFFKKNMTGLTVLALFGASAAVWDNDLFLKSIALSEIMPKRTVTISTLSQIYASEHESKISIEKKNGKTPQKEQTKPVEIDPGELFVMTDEEKKNFSDVNYLKKNMFIVDSRTDIREGDINGEKFINMDFSINKETDGPKILIFHTHSHEKFADSDPSMGNKGGIVGAGEYLKELLENKYGIETMHCTESFDYVDSKMTTTGAYERMEPVIEKILAENPSIEIAIDLHRDGLGDETKKLVTEINGKPTAQIMFFNGLCKIYENDNLVPTAGLDNPYLEQNLAFSFTMKYAADKMYPGYDRKNYLNAYRYSLNMLPKSLLVEVGAQTNTQQEAMNAMEPLAEILVNVINKNT